MAVAVAPSWSYSSSSKIQIRASNSSFFELQVGGEVVASSPDVAALLRYAFNRRIANAGELADMANKFGVPLSDVLLK